MNSVRTAFACRAAERVQNRKYTRSDRNRLVNHDAHAFRYLPTHSHRKRTSLMEEEIKSRPSVWRGSKYTQPVDFTWRVRATRLYMIPTSHAHRSRGDSSVRHYPRAHERRELNDKCIRETRFPDPRGDPVNVYGVLCDAFANERSKFRTVREISLAEPRAAAVRRLLPSIYVRARVMLCFRNAAWARTKAQVLCFSKSAIR